MVVRFFPLAATHFAKARACSTVIGVSTRTASRSPEIRVDEIGGHGRCFSPGGKSLVMAGMLGDKNTSHLRDVFRVVRLALDSLVLDCPRIERAWSARIGQVVADTRAIPKALDRNSRLEVIMASFRLDLGSAAVNEHFDTRDETGVIRRQKQRHLSYFPRFPHAPHRDGGHNPRNHVRSLPTYHRRIDRTRTNNV